MMKRHAWVLVVATLLLSLTGCWERLSWSPNGRYLAFIGPDDGAIWLWDTREGEASPLEGDALQNVWHCQFFSNRGLVYFPQREGGSDKWDLWLCRGRERRTELVAVNSSPSQCCVSADGKYLYYITHDESGGTPARYVLTARGLGPFGGTKTVYESEKEFGYPNVSRSGSRIVFCGQVEDKVGIHVLERGSSRTWCAVPGVSDEEYSWPMWVARDTIIFLRKVQGDDDQVARLMIGDVQKGTARELCEGVNIWDVPSVNAERTEAAVMAFVGGAEEDASTGDAYNWQVVSVNLKTGEKRILTDEPLGAGLSAYNPKANKIAYMTPPDFECDFATYRILDLDSGVTMMIHRGAEEQLLATALQLEEDGDFERAVAAYDRLVKQYPDSRFAEAAGLYAFVLRLRYPELGLEPVLSALPHMNLDELRPRERVLAQRLLDEVAQDSSGN